MNANPNIVDVTEANFASVMMEESQQRLVLLDFWADWCAPCKALGPILEKLANEYGGAILLAKVNADEQQAIVAQFGIRSLPTVALVRNGQPIDAFQGAEPESAIRERLQQHLPAPWEAGVRDAEQLMQEGCFDQALSLLREAYAQSDENFEVGLLLVNCYLNLKRVSDAQQLLEGANMEQQLHPMFKELQARLDVMLEALDTPAIRELQIRLADEPDNLELKYELAIQMSQNGRMEEALQIILEVLQKDRNFNDGAVRKTMVDLLSGLGKGDPLAVKYQRKLFTLMY
ncbi:MAG: thioredoxin [Reinekea sp.]|jgi:putative thioredoxin